MDLIPSSSSSSSSEEDSACSDGDSSDDDTHRPRKRPRTCLPPPFESSLLPQPRPAPSASSADGRVRTFAHVDGNWPTHVFLKLGEDARAALRASASPAVAQVARSCTAGRRRRRQRQQASTTTATPTTWTYFGADNMHVSLSRCVVLRHHHIDPFVAMLRKALRGTASTTGSGTQRFELDRHRVLVNDARTRSFVVFPVREGAGRDGIVGLIRRVDDAMREFRQPPYYADPLPHVSVAWAAGDHVNGGSTSGKRAAAATTTMEEEKEAEKGAASKKTVDDDDDEGRGSEDEVGAGVVPALGVLEASEVICTIGKKVFRFELC